MLPLNAWPSFADLMLAIVLILLIVVAGAVQMISSGVDTALVEEAQEKIVQALEDSDELRREVSPAAEPERDAVATFVSVRGGDRVLTVENELATSRQHFTFGASVLFEPDQTALKEAGERILSDVGNAIKPHLNSIREIQIHGHADVIPTFNYEQGNLELAALRAVQVFQFLHKQVGIDPVAQTLMSATSYGEYKPVDRRDRDQGFDQTQLDTHNSTDEKKAANRRIELELHYRGAAAR